MGATCAKERQNWEDVKRGPDESVFVDQMPDKFIYDMQHLPRAPRELRDNHIDTNRGSSASTRKLAAGGNLPGDPDGDGDTAAANNGGWGSDAETDLTDNETLSGARTADPDGAPLPQVNPEDEGVEGTSSGAAKVIRPYRNERAPVASLSGSLYKEMPGDTTFKPVAASGLDAAAAAAMVDGGTNDQYHIILPARLTAARAGDGGEGEELALLINAAEAEVTALNTGDDSEAMRRKEAKRKEEEKLQRVKRIEMMARKFPHFVMGLRSERGKMYVTTSKYFTYNHGVARKGLSKDIRMEIARSRRQRVIANETERQLVLKFEEDEAAAKALRKVNKAAENADKQTAFL